MTIQPDGKIVVAGQSFTAEVSGISVFALVRYNTNGSLDTSFDGDGKLSTEFAAGNADVRSVFLQSDGKIVAAGNRNLARYLGNGTLDNTFGGGGRVLISGMNIFAAAIQPDGGIVIAGSGSPVQFSDFAVGRITPAGFFDPTFDTDGRVFVDFGTTNDSARSLVIQSDGKIVTAGFAGVTDSSVFALTRHNTDGSLDTTFSGDGKETTAFTVPNSAASGVALQSDGKIVAAGTAGGSAASDFALARYQNGGAPAASVTIGGRAVTAGGRGISKVRISLTDASGNVRTVSTSSFGYYSFTGVGTGQTYTLTARAKRATFANSPQVVFISGARGDLDFNALP